MKREIAIQTRSLSKEYLIRRESGMTKFMALDNIDLDISKGSVTGIIGRNGAGKSTLLKILSRITPPTRGTAILKGRLSSLLEVGTGFHPELTGRDNVFLNGALLGMSRKEIKSQYDAIVEFAGILPFMETPVKHYSSGMYVRLAFAVAAHLRTEVLLIDEVLAVGDAAFQKKCLQRTKEARMEEGRTVLFVSHNMSAVRELCQEVVWLDQGKIRNIGDADKITSEYLSDFRQTAEQIHVKDRSDRLGTGDVIITGLEWYKTSGVLISGAPATLKINYQSGTGQPVSNLNFRLNVFKENGEFLTTLSNEMAGTFLENLPPQGEITCNFDALPFLAGDYYITSNILVSSLRTDQVERALNFHVEPGDRDTSGAMRTNLREGVRLTQLWQKL